MNFKNGSSLVDLSWKRYILPPIHKEGVPFVIGFALATVLLFMMGKVFFLFDWIATVFLLMTVFTYYFFRNPDRVTPIGESLVIAPADGIISNIAQVVPPIEIDMGSELLTRISIFMSVFNVHVNRSPVSGLIHKKHYRPGKFVSVQNKDSEENEREEYCVIMNNGTKIGFVQIAGLVARRIVSFVKEGEQLAAGQRFGLIRFGSRVDVYLPKGIMPQVVLGQITVAGETVLADLNAPQSSVEGEIR